jgi:hypothetical protein
MKGIERESQKRKKGSEIKSEREREREVGVRDKR